MADIEIHRNLDDANEAPASAHACACGEHGDAMPELDVQTIPHAVRHAAIFGALESLHAGSGIVLSATHDPVPLLMQLGQRHPDAFETDYLDCGPERWRIKIVRVA